MQVGAESEHFSNSDSAFACAPEFEQQNYIKVILRWLLVPECKITKHIERLTSMLRQGQYLLCSLLNCSFMISGLSKFVRRAISTSLLAATNF